MKVITATDALREDLMGIVVISHGQLCLGALDSLALIADVRENVSAVALEMGDDPDEYREVLARELDRYPAGCLVMVDVMGGTPYNSLMMLSRKRRTYGIVGFVFPALLEAAMLREGMTPQELEQILMESLPDYSNSLSTIRATFGL